MKLLPTSRLGNQARAICAAAAVSATGDGLLLVALPLLVVGTTRSPTAVAAVVVAQRLPWLVLAMPLGALADRLPRLLTMAVVDVVRLLIAGVLGLAVLDGRAPLAAVYATAFALGSLEILFSASANAAMPGLVADSDLDRANGLLTAAQLGGEQLLGPAIGGVLFTAAASLPLFGDAASYGASAALLASARGGQPAGPPSRERERLWREVALGLRAFWDQPALRALALVVAGLALCQAVATATLALYGLHILGLSRAGFGLFVAFTGAGNVLGALLARRARLLAGTAVILLVGGGLAACAYLLMSVTSAVVVAAMALAVEAVAVACGNVASLSLRQRLAPPELRGRITTTFRAIIWGVIPLGALLGGVVGSTFGLRAPLAFAGLLQVALLAFAAPALVRHVGLAESGTPFPALATVTRSA